MPAHSRQKERDAAGLLSTYRALSDTTPCKLPRVQKLVITCYTICSLLLLLDENHLQTNARFGVTSQTKTLNFYCLQVMSLPDDGGRAGIRNIDHGNDTVSIEADCEGVVTPCLQYCPGMTVT
jgi:hypothetical protein